MLLPYFHGMNTEPIKITVYLSDELYLTLSAWMKANKVKSLNKAMLVLVSKALGTGESNNSNELEAVIAEVKKIKKALKAQGLEL